MKAKREPDGFRSFVSARWVVLVRYGAALTGDAGLGEDLAQDALVKTLRAWPRLHPDGNAEAYTRQVMARAAWRSSRRRWWGERPAADVPDTASHHPQGDVETRADLLEALRTLPAEQRVVLVLRYWEDLTEEQIADQLGIARGTVKSRAARAVASLRALDLLAESQMGDRNE